MEYTLQNAYSKVVSANTLYMNSRARWQFLLESYLGGDDYRRGQHLTRYETETIAEYQARIQNTPLSNQCKSVISVYTSFLFRDKADRIYNSLENNLNLQPFLDDCDMDGRNLEAFMKEVAIWSGVFGHCWILVAKPQSDTPTRAGELEQGIRPYLNLITPLTVTDWTWHRTAAGSYELTYLKYLEEVNDTFSIVKEWTKDSIVTYQLNNMKQEITNRTVEPNELGKIPAVIAYASRSPVRGIGNSLINDIADYQQQIYNLTSEVEQSIRLNGHPTLVKTPTVECSAGAGAIALMPEDMDPALKPYLLNVVTDISSIQNAINNCVDAIDKMANTGAVRATATSTQSGVAMETEFQLLNAKLSEFADSLELTEEQIWILFAEYEGQVWDGVIQYPGAFNIRDTANEYRNLQVAKSAATTPEVTALIDLRLRELMEDPRFVHQDDAPANSEQIQQHLDILNTTTEEQTAPQTSPAPSASPTAAMRPRYNIQLGTQANG
jgi:hypothetical protein